MDWRTYYKEHTMKPEDAVSVIKDGDRVVFGHAVGEPIIFQRTMARMAQQFHNVEVAHMVYLGSGEYLQPGMEDHFRHNALFVGGPARKAIAENRADYTPAFFSDVPHMFRISAPHVEHLAHVLAEHAYLQLSRATLPARIIIADAFLADIAGGELDFAEDIGHHDAFLARVIVLGGIYHIQLQQLVARLLQLVVGVGAHTQLLDRDGKRDRTTAHLLLGKEPWRSHIGALALLQVFVNLLLQGVHQLHHHIGLHGSEIAPYLAIY